MQKRKKKSIQGITLVSLVITIIIMLILAGVVTNLAMSTEGLFAKAKKASEEWEESTRKEEIMISELQGAREVYQDGVNAPRLGTNMIPVYYDEGWKKADSTNSENSWYQYGTTTETKKWANAVTVTESSREAYLKVNVGTAIKEEDILGMFVWIPRYAYRITAGYHPASDTAIPLEGMVDIKFLIGTTDEYEGGNAIRSNNTNAETNGGAYVVHPAFTADTANGGGSKESIGFWVAKFEASSNTTTASNPNIGDKYGHTNNATDEVTVRPNVTSWRYISAPEIYKVCKKMNAEGNIHGLTSIVNPHMMKNSEWGAIAYLTQSEYGNPQTKSNSASGVWNNSYYEGDLVVNESSVSMYCTTMTGMVGSNRDDGISEATKAVGTVDKSNSEKIEITYQQYNSDGTTNGTPYIKTYYRYQTEQGQKGSTTGNIYGIYDLAGGAWEYVAGYLGSAPATIEKNGIEEETYVGYFKKLVTSERQEYAGEGETISEQNRKANYQANFNKYGDATWETSRDDSGASSLSWNSDYALFPFLSFPFFQCGGGFNGTYLAGVFAFHYAGGGLNYFCGFRPVVGV